MRKLPVRGRGAGSTALVLQSGAASIQAQPKIGFPGIGFRLVFGDDVFQENRGRCWQSPVPRPEWNLDLPTETADNVGFRLAWERT